ncbi:ParB family chromosome partitioning protein [Halanaerobium sp. MA284_MarDTE_T2]|nr:MULTISPECIES: ParB/RepB/Spo0J family partition protein [unclassified Halanaerobium]RCW41456.1 ParB family chromosome partitioning protein [Halanaerobium sp. MA284_MarDTE_T2]RCW79730.1 ParB family chromosome partitioning protein [Halanaerobium sp. DL-01]
MSKKRLGKGLSALINDQDNIDSSSIENIFIENIEPNPYQPRKHFDEKSMLELSESIKEKGVIQPVTVRKIKAEKYQLVAGERRWRAAKKAGLDKIPAVVKNFSDQEVLEIALIENIQREDLNPIEEAEAYKQMLDEFNFTQEEVAGKVGKSRSNIANMVRLLNLADKVKNHLSRGTISVGHARALLGLDDESAQVAACENIIIQDLTVRETENYVDKLKNPSITKKSRRKEKLPQEWQEAARVLSEKLGSTVKIKQKKRNNLLMIEIDSIDKIKNIIKKLS